MTVRHVEKLKKPLSVDGDFLDRLKVLILFAKATLYQKIAHRRELSVERVEEIAAGLNYGDINSPADKARQDIRSYDRLSIKLRYRGTKQFTTQSIEESIDFLREEFGICDQFNITFGNPEAVYIDLDIDDKYESITYDIRADRVVADTLQIRTVEMLKESLPPYPLLHSVSMTATLYVITAISATLLYLILMLKFRNALSIPAEAILGFASVPFFLAFAVGGGPVTKQYRKTFPLIQFEFGNQKKRRDASKTATAFLMSLIFMPILLSVLGF